MKIIKEALKYTNKYSNKIPSYVEKRLTYINYSEVNRKKAIQIVMEMSFLGLLYMAYCYYFFHGIWYLNFLIIISTFIFMYNYLDVRLEFIHKKTNKDIPKTTNKLRYYLNHTKNIETALEKTEIKSPSSTRSFIKQLKYAIRNEYYENEIDKIKKSSKTEWMKIICTLVKSCKIHGNKDYIITNNFKKTTKTINFINLNQGLDNAAILGVQLFVFFLPLVAIPGILLFNKHLLDAFQQSVLLGAIEGQIKSGRIVLESNLYTLFLSWIRKNN